VLWVTGVNLHLVGISTIAIAFFSLGAYLAMYWPDKEVVHNTWFYVVGILFIILSIILACLQEYVYREYLGCILALVGVASIPSLFSNLISRYDRFGRIMTDLSSMTFFIYASHAIIQKPIHNQLLSLNYFSEMTVYWLTFIVTISICMVAYTFSKKYIPQHLFKLLVGR
jgi:fucose 4-O-acetylase-like acetyltransferase